MVASVVERHRERYLRRPLIQESHTVHPSRQYNHCIFHILSFFYQFIIPRYTERDARFPSALVANA